MNKSNNNPFPNQYTPEPSRSAGASPDAAIDITMRTLDDNDDNHDQQQQQQPPPPVIMNSPRRRCTLKDRIKRNMANDYITTTSSFAGTTAAPSSSSTAAAATTSVAARNNNGSISNGGGRGREDSILAAASALASLGVTSPSSSFCSGGGGGAAIVRQTSMGSHGSAPLPSSSSTSRAVAVGGGGGENYYYPNNNNLNMSVSSAPAGGSGRRTLAPPTSQTMLSMIHPPPNLMVVDSSSSNGGGGGGDTRISSAAHHALLASPPRDGLDNASQQRPFASLLGSDIPLTFPQKLMEVLSNPQVSDIITWLPHGKGFIILQKHKFALDVMPLYFKHSKFTSFTRKLNRWGFHRVSRGPEMGAYYHKYFQRGNYLLCMQMHCQSTAKPIAKDASKDDDDDAAATKSSPMSSPKAKPAFSSPRIKSSPNVASAMSTLQLDGEDTIMACSSPMTLPPPAAAAASQTGTSALLRTTSSNSSSSSAFSSRPEAVRHASAKVWGGLSGFVQRQEMDLASGAFDRKFNNNRREEIPRERHQVQEMPSHRMMVQDGSGGQVNQFQGRSLQAPVTVQQSSVQPPRATLKSCMKQQQQQQPFQGGSVQQPFLRQSSPAMQRQQRPSPQPTQHPRSNTNDLNQQQYPLSSEDMTPIRALAIQKILGVNTSSSQNHPLVINNALNALKACNDQALLTALMTKEHNNSSGRKAPHTELSTYQVQSRVHAAMEAQLQQLVEYNKDQHYNNANATSSTLASSQQGSTQQHQSDERRSVQQSTPNIPPPRVQDSVHAAMLAQMKQLDKSNRQRLVGMSSGMKASSNASKNPMMSQSNVAQLYNHINNTRQRGNGAQSGEQRTERKYSRAVRRASAA